MPLKIAINGFGRIGRLAFRHLFGKPGYEVVCINDLTNPRMLAHLLKYDTTQGPYGLGLEIKADENYLYIGKEKIKISAIQEPSVLPWEEFEVDIVLECTGFFNKKEKAEAHLAAGAKKVILSAPAGKDVPTIVYGINEKTITEQDNVISAASCTTNCLAPLAHTLHQLAPIKKGIMSTVHAYTGDQMVLDGAHRKGNLRRARAAGENIVPTSTGAAKAIGLVVPELEGKLDGAALRVPVPAGSIVELVALCEKEIDVTQINEAMKKASSESFGYTEDEIVSSDIVGSEFGSIFDATLSYVTPMGNGETLVKISAWYDNENGYTCQLIRLLEYVAKLNGLKK